MRSLSYAIVLVFGTVCLGAESSSTSGSQNLLPLHFASGSIGPSESPHADVPKRLGFVRAQETPFPQFVQTTRQFLIYPFGGDLDRDMLILNFIDLEETPGVLLDYHCGQITYDGHNGMDVTLRSFAEQAIGVPIFATLDGYVLDSHDGEFDMQTDGNPDNPANYIWVDHGSNLWSLSTHIKNGSVAVNPGDHVRAGQQIALIGSSGSSTWPHLHFGAYQDPEFNLFEPHAGACRSGTSNWVHQAPLDETLQLQDFGITWEDLSTYPGLPFAFPHSGQFATTDAQIWLWELAANVPASSTHRIVVLRPNGTTALDTGNNPINNAYYRQGWFYWVFNTSGIPGLNSTLGTWRVRTYFNGVQVVDAPLEVKTAHDPNFNRPPEAITISFDPPAPSIGDVLFCRVNSPSLTLDDKDFDVVRYEYVWKVDGVEIRHLTSAGQADAIPHHRMCSGSTVSCTVTPKDAVSSGAPVTLSVIMGGQSPKGDMDCDGDVDGDDFAGFQSCGTRSGITQNNSACVKAKLDADTDVDLNDYGIFQRCYGGPEVFVNPACGN